MRTRLCTAILLGLVVAPTALARNLGDVVQEAGAGWLIGTWQMEDEMGNKTTVSYRWALDKNLVMLDFRSARWNSKGMTFCDPAEDKVTYIAVDDRGGHLQGTWSLEGGNPLVVYEHTDTEGHKRRVGVLHKRVDDNTFKGEMYEVLDSGQLASQPALTVEMKRKSS